MISRVTIIGSGNVANHLAEEFSRLGLLEEIRSRNSKEGSELAAAYNVSFQNDITSVSPASNLVLLCISDDAIESVAKNLKLDSCILAHTSGFISMDVLQTAGVQYGSFYPLQTFTKNRTVRFDQIPILIDASEEETKKSLLLLADGLSRKASFLADEKRSPLHLAAVISNNFTNHLLALAKQYCEQQELDFSLLKPLIIETFSKGLEQDPKSIQTGPAKRQDLATIDKHLALIEDDNLKAIYKEFTASIQAMYE